MRNVMISNNIFKRITSNTILKRICLTPLAICLTVLPSAAQTPGGVEAPTVWTCDTATVNLPSSAGLTYISVNRVMTNKEQTVWSLGMGNKTSRIQTTARAANLKNSTFMNYAKDSLPEVRLYSYTTALGCGDGSMLHIGSTPDRSLPVSRMDGGTTEYTIFSRQLTDQERSRVESYFALKYGISLRSSYLNGHGKVIWNAYRNKTYSHRIAGIIADATSALYQSRGSSSEGESFITIKSKQALVDGQSLLWGDNGKRLAITTSKAYGRWLGRHWLTSITGMDATKVDLMADSRELKQIQPLQAGEHYYLAIDPTGTGKFPIRQAQYYKADAMHGDSIIFSGITLGDHSAFTLRAAGDMFTTIEVTQPTEQANTGSLGVRVTGGEPPYAMMLSRDGATVYNITSADMIRTINDLAEGKYLLSTTDHEDNKAENEFQITTTGITEIPSSEEPSSGDNFFARVKVNPIPATDGYVDVQAELSEEAPLSMTLYTSSGAMVSSITLAPDTYFTTRIALPAPGVFLLTLKSGNHEKTIKIL